MIGMSCRAAHLGFAILLCSVLPGSAQAEEFANSLRQGDSLGSVLSELNRLGYRISYSSNVVLPDMHLKRVPRATDLETLLSEILAPWSLSALKAGENDYLIVGSREPITPVESDGDNSRPLPTAALETIDVTATRFGIASEHPEAATTLSARDVRRIPHLGDDAMRVLRTLPGTTGRDVTAKMNVRGGRPDELLMLIDGAEIHNGFHFQDRESGFLSLVDTNLVRSMDLTTGGMTAPHGDVMSGVVDIQTRQPSIEDEHHHAVGISFISSYARTSRMFADGRGSWIASARRSYLDLLMKEVQDSEERITPEYQDAFSALRYDVSERTHLSAHALLGADELIIVQNDDSAREGGKGETSHLWFTLDHAWSDTFEFSTVLSWATGRRERDSFDERDGAMIGDVVSNAEFEYFDLRQDWQWLASDDHLIGWGLSASRHDASYDYRLQSLAIHPFDPSLIVTHDDTVDLDVSGDKLGAYGVYRTRFGDAFTAELGGRWDSYKYRNGRSYSRLSPRFNAVYRLNERSELRAAWGVMHQPHAVDRLEIEDGQTQFHQPEIARHIVVSYATQLFDTVSLRVDGYRKDYEDLRPRYENEFSSVNLIAEAEADRIRIDASRARTQGIELSLRRDTEEQWGGWITYGYGQAEELDNATWRPRSWEQLHSLTVGIGRSGATWDVNLAAFYHSGTPFTPVYLQGGDGPPQLRVEHGARNSARLDHYLRFDLRASRKVIFESSALTYYFEVFNLANRENPCCIDRFEASQRGNAIVADYNHGFPRLPSFGFHYEF